VSTSLSAEECARARRVLMRRDPVLRDIIKRYGPCDLPLRAREDPFIAIVKAIVWQQLSTKAAETIYRRFLALYPDGRVPLASEVLETEPERLRAAGLSRAKVVYLRDLSQRVMDGSLPLDALEALADEEVIEALVRVKGIGRWSAEMFLMFRLRRPDVLPVGDLGIVRAVQRAYGLRRAPDAVRLRRIGEAWRPYRTLACWYLWRSLESAPVS
jgi:DNA-3-methyladenine glycosylase II